MMAGGITILPVVGMPEVKSGEELGALLYAAIMQSGAGLRDQDIVVVTHKIVAKAEGATIDLSTIEPSPVAVRFATRWKKDPRHVEVVLRQSERIVRMDRGVIIAETAHGLICANAGVDQSNMPGRDIVCVLPEDPDRSARSIRTVLEGGGAGRIGVIICDTFGRPWREGLTNVAIGVAGLRPVHDYSGMQDANGHTLRVSAMAVADEIAGAAELVMGKLARVPAAIVRGYPFLSGDGSHRELLRSPELDMFR